MFWNLKIAGPFGKMSEQDADKIAYTENLILLAQIYCLENNVKFSQALKIVKDML